MIRNIPVEQTPFLHFMLEFDHADGGIGGCRKNVTFIQKSCHHAENTLQCAAMGTDQNRFAGVFLRQIPDNFIDPLLEIIPFFAAGNIGRTMFVAEGIHQFRIFFMQNGIFLTLKDAQIPFPQRFFRRQGNVRMMFQDFPDGIHCAGEVAGISRRKGGILQIHCGTLRLKNSVIG